MQYLRISALMVFVPIVLTAQNYLLPSEATAIEAAWASGLRLQNTNVVVLHGFGSNSPLVSATTDVNGIGLTSTKQWERIEVHLPRVLTTAHMICLMVNGKCGALPVGASIDKIKSIFYWHVPNAYKGAFNLVFLQQGDTKAGVLRVTAGSEVVTRLSLK